MIDFGKLYCDLHHSQIITNFCLKETCMVGLCATCICTHTQYHINNKTTPEYQNIRATFSSMHETIRKRISSLQNQKNRIDKISGFVQTKRKTIKQNIQQTRRHAISVVNNFYDNKEKNLLRQMQNEQKKMGLHSEVRMQSLMNSLSRQKASLITSAQQLNSQNFLQSYQRIKTHALVNASKLQEDVSVQLDRNEDFQTIINSNDNYSKNIVRALQESLQISFKINHRPFAEKTQFKETFANNGPAFICPQKVTSRFGARLQESMTTNRPWSTADTSNFQAISFNNVPEMIKNLAVRLNDQQLRQNRSIPIYEEESSTRPPSGRQNRSFINRLSRSQIMNQVPTQSVTQSQIFREKESNQRVLHQSLSKFPSGVNRNNQSQITFVQKPFPNQSNNNWNSGRVNNHQGMNYSMVETLPKESQQKQNRNCNSPIFFSSNKPSSVGMNQHKLIQPNPQIGQKFNFIPQMFYPTHSNKQNQNQISMGDCKISMAECKKVKKSGLTLLKANQTNINNSGTNSMFNETGVII